MNNPTETEIKKAIKRIKLGKLEGEWNDTKEGALFVDGSDAGTWSSDTVDLGFYNTDLRTIGYDAEWIIDDVDYSVGIERKGARSTSSGFHSATDTWSFDGAENCQTTKARLRREIALTLLAHEAAQAAKLAAEKRAEALSAASAQEDQDTADLLAELDAKAANDKVAADTLKTSHATGDLFRAAANQVVSKAEAAAKSNAAYQKKRAARDKAHQDHYRSELAKNRAVTKGAS